MNTRDRLARSARRDLQEISDFWTFEAGEDFAFRVVSAVMETIITMSGQPDAGIAADWFGFGIRKFPAGRYIVYCRPYPRGIGIVHVFHGARDQKKAWTATAVK